MQPPLTPVQRASVQAARLIEAAMHACTAHDIRALDCLLEARRALSPLVDLPAAPPGNDTAAS